MPFSDCITQSTDMYIEMLFSDCITQSTDMYIEMPFSDCISRLLLQCLNKRHCSGRDRMVVGFTTTCAISAFHN